MKQSNKGLKKIPEYISAEVDDSLISLLNVNGHGLSFPHHTFCQVRIKRETKTYSRCFPYSKYNSIEDTIKIAMKYYLELKEKLIEQGIVRSYGKGYGGINFIQRIDKRRDTEEYYHAVWYINPETGKRRQRGFYHNQKPTPGQWLHGHRTALYFKVEQERIASVHGTCIRHELFKDWKTKRLYEEGKPSVDYNSL